MAENRNRVCALRAVCQSLVWEEFGSNVCLAAFGCSIESIGTVSYDNVRSCNKVENVLNDSVADSFYQFYMQKVSSHRPGNLYHLCWLNAYKSPSKGITASREVSSLCIGLSFTL